MDRFNVIVTEPVQAMFIQIWGYVPKVVGALLILVVGWFLAKFIETVIIKVLKAVKLDDASDKAGITGIMAQGDIKMAVSELIGVIVYWLLMLVVLATVLNALNLTAASDILSKLVGYIPNIIGAIFILILGTFLANFTGTIVKTAANNAGITNAKMLSELTKTILVIFAIIIAVEQLGVGVAVINLAVSIILAAVGIAIGLAFGLGCKDMAGKAMADFLGKMKK